jgi:hypothetical protein
VNAYAPYSSTRGFGLASPLRARAACPPWPGSRAECRASQGFNGEEPPSDSLVVAVMVGTAAAVGASLFALDGPPQSYSGAALRGGLALTGGVLAGMAYWGGFKLT